MSEASQIDSARSWRVALAAALLIGVSFGSVYSFGAFFDAMATDFDSGLGATSIVFALTTFGFFGFGAISGAFADRWGVRPLVIVGGTMFTLGLFLTSRATELWHGYLSIGLGVGIGGGIFSSSVYAVTAGWFERFRGIAQGIVAAGSGLGTLILLPLTERLIERDGWRDTYVTLSIISGAAFVIGTVFLARPPVQPPKRSASHLRSVLATPAFRRLWLCGALNAAAFLSAFAFIVTFADDRGVSSSTAAAIVSVVGAASIIGRLGLTSVAGRLGPVRMLQISLFIQPIGFAIWLIAGGNVAQLVLFAMVFGTGYGGFVAVLPLVSSHLFGLRGLGTVMGWVFLSTAVGGLLGPPVVGFVADLADGQLVPKLLIVGMATLGAVLLLGLQDDPVELPDATTAANGGYRTLGKLGS